MTRRSALVPVLAACLYPFVLDLAHWLLGPPGTPFSVWRMVAGGVCLVACCAVLPIGMAGAVRLPTASLRRLAYASVAAPTLYVFLGVLQFMAHSPVPDEVAWLVLWGVCAGLAFATAHAGKPSGELAPPNGLRFAHGCAGAIAMVFVLFHLANHLCGLAGPAVHAAVMAAGRHVYRAAFVEPLLVAVMLFQVGSGLSLAWRWSAERVPFQRLVQVATGVYLSVFILGHMNSVFVFARLYLHIPTGWAFATGAPTGLLHDPWNIRLIPHYALGVFAVLVHLVSGLRVVLLAHGLGERWVGRLWWAGVAGAAIVASGIMAGMCGLRL